jgi:hypothetical protein
VPFLMRCYFYRMKSCIEAGTLLRNFRTSRPINGLNEIMLSCLRPAVRATGENIYLYLIDSHGFVDFIVMPEAE